MGQNTKMSYHAELHLKQNLGASVRKLKPNEISNSSSRFDRSAATSPSKAKKFSALQRERH